MVAVRTAGCRWGACAYVPERVAGHLAGYYMALGDRPLPPTAAGPVRLYWHLDAEGAAG